jgi:hypothetical protein
VAGALDNAQIIASLIPLAELQGDINFFLNAWTLRLWKKHMLISPAQNPKQCPALFIVPPQQSSYWKNHHPKGIKSLSI